MPVIAVHHARRDVYDHCIVRGWDTPYVADEKDQEQISEHTERTFQEEAKARTGRRGAKEERRSLWPEQKAAARKVKEGGGAARRGRKVSAKSLERCGRNAMQYTF